MENVFKQNINQYAGKRVVVMGLGLNAGGVGAAKFFSRAGAKVLVTDLKDKKYLACSLKKLKGLPIKYILGRHRETDFKNADLIIKGPGVPNDSFYLKIARAAKIPIDSDVGIFFGLCPAPIIGITGTKGKSTTAFLTAQMLAQKRENHVWLAGNIRTSVFEILPKIKKEDLVVLELSSFQLEALAARKKSPAVALVTNVMRDHLDRYADLKSYLRTKKLIFKFQKPEDWLFLNRDDKLTKSMAAEARSQIVFFGRSDLQKKEFRKLANEIKKFPRHIAQNIIAAASIAILFKVPENLILAEIKNFKGLEGRGEEIICRAGQRTGIKFINDTCATIPDAAAAALKNFANRAKGGKVILICGGTDKNLDFRRFVKILPKFSKLIVLLPGTATEKIKKELLKLKKIPPVMEVENMKTAVLAAFNKAGAGDIILLSPAAASFGIFKNEFDRGEQFKQCVFNLENRK